MRNEHYIVGCDLGQSQDYTALAVVERVRAGDPPGMVPAVTYGSDGNWTVSGGGYGAANTLCALPPRYNGTPQAAPYRPVEYHVRHLERPPLGTKYPAVVARVQTLLATPPLSPKTPLVVDRTGVGVAVTDLFSAVGLAPYAVTITGGDGVIRDGAHLHFEVRKNGTKIPGESYFPGIGGPIFAANGAYVTGGPALLVTNENPANREGEITSPVPQMRAVVRDALRERGGGEGGGEGGITITGPVTIHADTYAGGQQAARGLMDELRSIAGQMGRPGY